MAASYNSITCKVINRLASTRLGIAGYSFNGGGKCNLLLTNGAAQLRAPAQVQPCWAGPSGSRIARTRATNRSSARSGSKMGFTAR